RLAGLEARVGGLRHGSRRLRRLQHEGIERVRLLDRGEVRVGELSGREAPAAEPVARLCERQRRELCHSLSGSLQTKGFAALRGAVVPGAAGGGCWPGTGRPAAPKSAAVKPSRLP